MNLSVRRKRLRANERDRSVWSAFAENGWLGAGFSEEDGGFGGGPAEVAIIGEEVGRALVVEPYMANVVSGMLVARYGTPSQKQHVEAMIAGSTRLAFAFAEDQSRFDLDDCLTSARSKGNGYSIDGRKIVVPGGDEADYFVVVVRASGSQRDRDGLSLALVPKTAAGVTVSSYPTVDERGACDLRLDGVAIGADDLIGGAGQAWPAIEFAGDYAAMLVCAEAIGAMNVAMETTLEYLKQRVQFGKPLAQNQVLQHRLVDMHVALKEADALTRQAVKAIDAPALERSKATSAAKISVGRAARLIGQETVQLHGGIGTTDEANASHLFKRLTATSPMFGNVAWHEARYARILDQESDASAAAAGVRRPAA